MNALPVEPSRIRLLGMALWALLLQLPIASAASNCDEIRDRIEAKVRASGVQQFSLTVVDAAASSAGRVVGSCDRGSRKIVYRADAAAAAAAPAASTAPARPVLTECREGRVLRDGKCSDR